MICNKVTLPTGVVLILHMLFLCFTAVVKVPLCKALSSQHFPRSSSATQMWMRANALFIHEGKKVTKNTHVP